MVNVDEAFELKYKRNGESFEILVDFEKYKEFKKNPEKINIYDVLADDKIFKDQKKGEIASENLLKEIFNNKTIDEILTEILLKGDCQIPTAYLNKLRKEKKEQVINYIVENATNPQNKSKYTSSMISSEIDKLKFNFDPNINFISQAEDILKLLKKIMPISMDKIIVNIKIPGEFCGNFYGNFRKFGTIKKEYYDNSGNLVMHFEIMESLFDTITTNIKNNSNNQGEYYIMK